MSTVKKKERQNPTNRGFKQVNGTSCDEEDDDIPVLTQSFWESANIGSPLRKSLISLRLDNDVIDWFKNSGPNYQTRMNQVLRTYMQFSKSKA